MRLHYECNRFPDEVSRYVTCQGARLRRRVPGISQGRDLPPLIPPLELAERFRHVCATRHLIHERESKVTKLLRNTVGVRTRTLVGRIRVETRSLHNTCGVPLKDKCRNSDIEEQCGLKEGIVTRVEKVFYHPQAPQAALTTATSCTNGLMCQSRRAASR
ncbi:hypothetical protein EVAR_47505_1 [Eumeta japonica]|uniref:Uncharacterized protein n=1 Tax=Eumeta variegata TaxID=151549 RepID=A0A4C1XV36_EUMVA|nr:hypothetical protein EVAR_47505_1 [Eumeta japonica]